MPSKPELIWIDANGCNGCSHSFLNYTEIDSFFEDFNIFYHPLFPTQELEIRECDILIIEGALRRGDKRGGHDILALCDSLIKKAKNVVAFGTCAVYGGMFGSGVLFDKDEEKGFVNYKDKIINIPGCPPHPQWLGFVLGMLKENKKIVTDEFLRPVEIFAYTSHMGCSRNEYFEWKIDSQFGEKEGCLYYQQGCQGPFTHSSCNRILWNEVSSKPRAGIPCFGCTEPFFPKNNLFETETFMGIPANIPLGVGKRAYFTLAGVAKSLKNERLSKKLIECENENNRKNN